MRDILAKDGRVSPAAVGLALVAAEGLALAGWRDTNYRRNTMHETMQTRTILDDIGPRDAAVVTVACDTGLKYLAGASTEEHDE